ncbi:hypothetical protein E3N88_22764 [Mikania micrantha]|uniref:Uncharacterized protein n=1 Tax=Mikania micrantha TaxID=192012 RepID=A0A5N6NCT0_9ASTR|nr:hypothetical protein E3N88_22764 [Mikania micrantha]
MEIFEACGYHPEIGIKVLRQKTLITIVYKELYGNVFDMHDLVEEMGHYFVRGEHPMNPRKHSRVWKREEIKEMCFKDATMKLRWIDVIMYDVKSDEWPTFLSNELQYIRWTDFTISQLTGLKVLKLSLCDNLIELPDLPSSLVILNASYCKSLTTIGNCHRNCKWLSHVSLNETNILNGVSKNFLSVKQALSSVNSEDDVVWEEGDGDRITSVWYVSFGSLRDTAWWDQTYKALSFENAEYKCIGFGVIKEDQLRVRNALNDVKNKKKAKQDSDETLRANVNISDEPIDLDDCFGELKEGRSFGPMDRFANIPRNSKQSNLDNVVRKDQMIRVRDDLNANDAVVDFVGVLFPKDYEKQKEILSVELPIYKRKQGKFDRPIALKGCEVNDDAFDPVDEEDDYESDGVEIIEQYGQDDDEF